MVKVLKARLEYGLSSIIFAYNITCPLITMTA